MFPSSYHGYLTHSELPLIPMKVGCATRANLTMRESDLNSTNATTLNNTVSVSLQKRPQTMYGREYTNKSTMRPLDGLDKSGINRSGVHSSMSSTRPGNSMKITNHIHQNYRRDIPDQPDKEQALQNTFKSVQSHYAELKGLSESSGRVPNDYNIKKWTVESEFKPAAFPKRRDPTSVKELKNATFGSVGSVTDHRSFNRVKLERDFESNSTYRRDIGLHKENPRDRFADTEKQVSDVSSTQELFIGTAKSTTLPHSYMGHVPQTLANRSKMLESKNDTSKKNAKNHLVYTVEHNLPGYAGFKPHAVPNDKGPTKPGNNSIYTHSYQKHALLDAERPHHKQSMILKKFFTEPKGDSAVMSADGCADAETFYKKFRPHEALLKTGPADSRKWITDVDLKRSFIYTSAV